MAEVVDAIIADLIVRNLDKYEADFNRATAAHDRFFASTGKLKTQTFDLAAEGQKYKQGAGLIAAAEEQLTQRVTQTRKTRTTNAAAEDAKVTASAKKAAKEQADAAIAEAQREAAAVARIRAMVDKSTTSGGVRRGSGRIASTSVPGERTGQGAIPLSVLNGGVGAEVAAESEVNHMLADRAKLQSALTYASKEDAVVIREKLAEMRLINQLQKAGLSDAEIALALDQRALAVDVERAAVARRAGGKQTAKGLEQFARGSGAYAATGGGAAIAGIAVATGVAVGVEMIESSVALAKSINEVAKASGLTAEQLQVYRHAATEGGATTQQFDTAVGQLNANLAKARNPLSEQGKMFAALGVDVKKFASAGDALPTLIERISSIPDAAQRARVETALFGEEGRKLDGLLSGGNQRVNELAQALEKTGSVLSSAEIARLDEVGKKLEAVKAQLAADIAGVVANNADAIETLASAFAHLVQEIGDTITLINRLANTPVGKVVSKLSEYANYVNPVAIAGNLIDKAAKAAGAKPPPDTAGAAGLTAGQIIGGGIQSGSVNLGALDKLGPRGPKGRKAREPKRDTYADDLAGLQAKNLDLRADISGDIEDRYNAVITKIDAEAKAYDDATKAKKNLTAAEKKSLIATNAANVALEKQKASDDRAIAIAEVGYKDTQVNLAAIEEEIQGRLSLAKTVRERRDLELELLANQEAQRRNELNFQIAKAPIGSPDQKRAQDQLDDLPKQTAARRADVLAQNRGPLGDYLAGLPNTMAQVDEAMQKAAANGLQQLDDGLTSAVAKFLHLHGIAGQFLQDLIKIGIERELLIPLANTLFPQQGASAGLSGGGLSGIFGSIAKLFGGGGSALAGNLGADWGGAGSAFSLSSSSDLLSSLPAFATGGSGVFGGRHGTDNNILSLNGQPFARVNRGEPFAIGPNIGAANGRVSAPSSPNIVVVQPIHADFTGARTDEQTMRQFQQYADARSRQAYEAAVQTAGQQAPGVISRAQTLKG